MEELAKAISILDEVVVILSDALEQIEEICGCEGEEAIRETKEDIGNAVAYAITRLSVAEELLRR